MHEQLLESSSTPRHIRSSSSTISLVQRTRARVPPHQRTPRRCPRPAWHRNISRNRRQTYSITMGSCVSIQCKLCPNVNVNCSLEEIRGICCPESKGDILTEKMANLRAMKVDVEREIKGKLNSQVAVRNEVKTWLENVDELGKAVSTIVAPHPANGLLSCCYLCSDNKLEVHSKIGRVEEMIRQKSNWKDSIFMEKPKTYALECLPTNIVGMEQVVSQVLHYLHDDKVRVIGIHGMGGVGKTTLAKQVIKILDSSEAAAAAAEDKEMVKFDVIIWAAVSRNRDTRKLQEDIAVELGLHQSSEFEHQDESIRARFLSKYLSVRRFLLVLDDVWKQFDLTSIGIPELQEDLGNKIVLTTREEKVCIEMDARKSTLKLDCLGRQESWELFRRKIQWDENEFKERGIYQIAQDIVCKCRGLPLALVTIARAVASKSDIRLWRSVYESLKDSPRRIRGMDDVYRLLKFSYNSLWNEEYKSCLLYSALFPEDWEIDINRMVDYCIGGGSVSVDGNMSFDIVRLRDHGRFIISELIDACLLERGMDKDHVKVHDAIRDMILFWLKGDNGENRIVSHAGKDITRTHVIDVEEWRAASMLSFYHNPYLKELITEGGEQEDNHLQSNHLQVLLLNINSDFRHELLPLPRRLFEYFPHVRVLDLSRTNLRSIPASLCCLKFLQYLNLSWTKIQTLPKEMRKLSSLIQLDLSYTWELKKIPNCLFSSLSKLQSLNIFYCCFFVNGENRLQVLKEIGDLHLLKDVHLLIDGNVDVVKFLVDESHSLSNSITKLDVTRVDLLKDDLILQWMGSRLKKLEWLDINGDSACHCKKDLVIDDGHFSELKKLYIQCINCCHIILKGQALEHLTCLNIYSCVKLTDLACLWKLPNLEHLSIHTCDGVVEMMGPSQSEGDEIIHHQSFLPKVKFILLWDCTNLLRISSGPLQLHSLEELDIRGCPSLRDISMISSPQKLEISCKAKWWEDLRWENSGGVPPSNFIPNFGR